MANPQTTANILAGATITGAGMNWMDWVDENSVALTVIIVFTTGLGSIILSAWGKYRELKLSKERNEILKRQSGFYGKRNDDK
jgi:hypothetical protein